MAFAKITRIILYVLGGISLIVVLFFYIAPKTVDYDELEIRVTEIQNPIDITPSAPLPAVDTMEQDSTAVVETEDASALVTPVVTPPADTNLKAHLSGWEYMVWFRTDIALVWAYILILITLLASIVFPLISVISNRKGLLRLGAVLAGAAIMVIISYLMSNDTPMEIIGYTGTENSDPGTLKMIDTVLFVTYMLFGMALASILYAIASKAFK